ncbi:helix-turn-helix domain-containing protein [Rummeliibacillus suwonensis]|uniref:helix-turn-helix domain-containing protein n=1 Tax=Rummeliibacillus suwonensis TaxID=1306154 RepID=UPI001AAFEF07|nr:helix-turn-helix domain-containing protein [Rummeliibacillus suwonensis]MBO2536002.1 helix-turn-helix domain-containing protein [Rummeliibacillus suwonensis]
MTNERKTTNKALPFPGVWTAAPNDVLRNYWVHPKFTGNCFAVYMHLLDRYNPEKCYAWPTQDQIADALIMSRQTVWKILKDLEYLRLIVILDSPVGTNHVYVPLKPLESIEEIESAFPEVSEYLKDFREKRKRDRGGREQRKADFEGKLAMLQESVKNS